MSFGHGSNNPPWQRNSMGTNQGIPSLTNQINLGHTNAMVGFGGGGNQSLFGIPSGGQQQGNMSMIPPLAGTGMNSNQMFNQTVSYPPTTPRGNYSGGNEQQHSNANQNMTCNKIGIVTKIQNDYGFIDEEVFFHKNSCKGTLPKVGDRVLVEATYSNNSAFKWNATRVQVVNTTNQQSNISSNRNQTSNNPRSGSGYNAVPPPSGAYAGGFERTSGGGRGGRSSPPRRSPGRSRSNHDVRLREEEEERRRRREEREKEKEKDRLKEKQRDRSIEKRDHSPIRRTSPKRARRARVVPRYMVQVPKVTLNL